MVKANINNKSLLCLIDTGASASLLPSSLVEKHQIQPHSIFINGVNGQGVCQGKATLPFSFAEDPEVYQFNFLVYPVPRPILGNDILQKLNIQINFPLKSILYKQLHIPFYLHSEEINLINTPKFSTRIKISKRIILPSRQYTYVKVLNPLSNCMFVPSEKTMTYSNLLIPELYLPKKGPISIPILNPNSYPVQLNCNTSLGDAHRIVEVHHTNFKLCAQEKVKSNITSDIKFDINPSLPLDQRTAIEHLLKEYPMIFATSDTDIGHYPGEERMYIDTGNNPPINLPPYRKSHTERKIIREYIEKFLKAGIIEESCSDYASPILLVRKKDDNKFRVVVDYRFLNDITKTQTFPMPRLQDIFDTLYNAKYFSKMDVSNGFYSFKVAEEHRPKTSFITQDGIYQFKRVPQGMKNSPSFFNRILRKIFCGLLFKHVFLYLDDILCYGSTFDEHLLSLKLTFEKLRLNKLKLKSSKCSFGYNELKLLGHVISKDGIKVDPSKVTAIKNMPIPQNVSECRTFLGMAGYYRRFIKNYSIISCPLTQLTRKDIRFQWTPSCQSSFEILKKKLMTAPIRSQF